jgi:hypothetical protein
MNELKIPITLEQQAELSKIEQFFYSKTIQFDKDNPDAFMAIRLIHIGLRATNDILYPFVEIEHRSQDYHHERQIYSMWSIDREEAWEIIVWYTQQGWDKVFVNVPIWKSNLEEQ